jgi:hypothetical protein
VRLCCVLHVAVCLQVFVVNDLQQPSEVQLAVRLLSLTDTPAQCHSPSAASNSIPTTTTSSSTSGSTDSSATTSDSYAFKAAHHIRFHKVLKAEAPPGTATLIWSKSVTALLKKAGQGCSRTSCYVHITLAGEGVSQQEKTIWLAPFKDLPLQDPQLAVINTTHVSLTGDEGDILTGSGHRQEAVAFTVSSRAVAVYAVWEVQQEGAAALSGHFSDNALMIHPCEPREVTFLPAVGYHRTHKRASDFHRGVAGSTFSGVVDSADGKPAGSEPGTHDQQHHGTGLQGDHVLRLLQEQLVVTSLWEHQQFDGGVQWRHEEKIAVV